MTKTIILFLLLSFLPQKVFAKALCPAGITQEECCSLKNEMTMDQCKTSCAGICEEGYYGSCYTCQASLCFNSKIECVNASSVSAGICERIGSQYCLVPPIDEMPNSGSTATVSKCPPEATLSDDKCCCDYQ